MTQKTLRSPSTVSFAPSSSASRSPARAPGGHAGPGLLRDTRGATMVEYALMLCLVLAAASPLVGALGRKARASFQAATAGFTP